MGINFLLLSSSLLAAFWELSAGLLPHLIVHQGVQALPVALDLGGDVFILQHHPSDPALPPLWGEGKPRSEGAERCKSHQESPPSPSDHPPPIRQGLLPKSMSTALGLWE